ncbi:phosphotransferase family protein [bacterium]|nr:phosphotransferase family protein [bacterium]
MNAALPSPAGINAESVTRWLSANVAGSVAPFHFELIAGGHSNLTFSVTDSASHHYVLRRPPLSHALASAHDMGREHRVISALQHTNVPVAPTLAMCDDVSVNDAPFYVMGFVDGIIVRDPDIALKMLTPTTRLQASNSLVDTMAAIHSVDPVAVGLGELGRHDGYIERQLKRWYSQWNASKTRELTEIDRVHDGLLKHLPVQGPATIVHGDYRLDNCMINSSGDIIAVLDWELCTLGDPLADLGLLMVYWSGPTDEPSGTTFGTTTAEGFLNRAQLAERYAQVSGRDISHLDYYVAFAYWKLACIIEGVYARYISGAMGEQTDSTAFEPFKLQVEASARKAELLLSRLQ